jgi:hypothetical protein
LLLVLLLAHLLKTAFKLVLHSVLGIITAAYVHSAYHQLVAINPCLLHQSA